MLRRLSFLLITFVIAFGIHAISRMLVNLPATQRGYDAMDYVTLHGNIQFENVTNGSPRPTDVTGVFIVEGSANRTMIGYLADLPNLKYITIGPDHRLIPIGTPADERPGLSNAASDDLKRMKAAFPELTVGLADLRP